MDTSLASYERLITGAALQVADGESLAELVRPHRNDDNSRRAARTWLHNAMHNLGENYLRLGDLPRARAWLTQALELREFLGDVGGESRSSIGQCFLGEGRVDEAIDMLTAALHDFQELGDRRRQGSVLTKITEAHRLAGRTVEAVACGERALELCRLTGSYYDEARALWRLGNALADLGELETARSHVRQALAILRQRGDSQTGDVGDLIQAIAQDPLCSADARTAPCGPGPGSGGGEGPAGSGGGEGPGRNAGRVARSRGLPPRE